MRRFARNDNGRGEGLHSCSPGAANWGGQLDGPATQLFTGGRFGSLAGRPSRWSPPIRRPRQMLGRRPAGACGAVLPPLRCPECAAALPGRATGASGPCRSVRRRQRPPRRSASLRDRPAGSPRAVRRQEREAALQFAQLPRGGRIGVGHQHRSHFGHVDIAAVTVRPAHVVDVLVVHQREKPSPQIGPLLPQLLLGKRAQQRVLDQIVRPAGISRQRPRIAPQARDLLF